MHLSQLVGRTEEYQYRRRLVTPRHNFEDARAEEEQPSTWTTVLRWQRVVFHFSQLELTVDPNSSIACRFVFVVLCV
jgi:hypothetical protein